MTRCSRTVIPVGWEKFLRPGRTYMGTRSWHIPPPHPPSVAALQHAHPCPTHSPPPLRSATRHLSAWPCGVSTLRFCLPSLISLSTCVVRFQRARHLTTRAGVCAWSYTQGRCPCTPPACRRWTRVVPARDPGSPVGPPATTAGPIIPVGSLSGSHRRGDDHGVAVVVPGPAWPAPLTPAGRSPTSLDRIVQAGAWPGRRCSMGVS